MFRLMAADNIQLFYWLWMTLTPAFPEQTPAGAHSDPVRTAMVF